MNLFGKKDLKGFTIEEINEDPFKFRVVKGKEVYNKFYTREAALSWIKTVG
jgi:hypothetical protein